MAITQDRFETLLQVAERIRNGYDMLHTAVYEELHAIGTGKHTGMQAVNSIIGAMEAARPTIKELTLLGMERAKFNLTHNANDARRNRRHKMIALQEQQQAEGRINAEYERSLLRGDTMQQPPEGGSGGIQTHSTTQTTYEKEMKEYEEAQRAWREQVAKSDALPEGPTAQDDDII